jgi:serine/threonine-protein kinase
MAVLHGNDRNEPNDTDLAAGAAGAPAAGSAKPYPSVADVGHRYQPIKSLGGTPGDVLYLARDRQTGALVEVRAFTGDRGADADLIGALRHLAARAARVSGQCPGIATLSECERTGGVGVALAMTHHEGATLRETIRGSGGLHPERALPLAIKIAEILQQAHACGLVHGGLRPDNVVLTGPQPTVLLTHYGIDRILARWTALRRRKGTAVTTHTIYDAPEQAHGEMTERGDVYAFGAILYEMLAGSFPRTGIAPIRRGHLERLAKRRPGITPGLQRILTRTLQLKPERRPDLAALCEDLRAEIGGGAQPTRRHRRPAARRWARAWRTSLVAGGLIVALGLAIWASQAYLAPRDPRWALPWFPFAPASSRALPTPAAPTASPPPAASPPAPASPSAPAGPPAVASPSPTGAPAVASPSVEAPSLPPANAVTTVPKSPEPSSAPRGEEKTPPARTRPRPAAPRVETRREPAATRPGDAAPAERPSAPDPPNPQNPPEPTRGPRGSEDPGAVIDWLLNEGRRH